VKFLLSRDDVDITAKTHCNMTPLHLAKDIKIAKLLLTKDGVDITATGAQENTLLHFACEAGNVEMVKWLMSQDALDINSRNCRLVAVEILK